jgi:peptidyl-prolyl cis-trans isomerase C
MRFHFSFMLLTLTCSAACAQDSSEGTASPNSALGPGEVAVVNGQRIPQSVYRLFTLGTLQTNADNLTAEQRVQVVDRLIYMELLAQEAERRGLGEERRIAAELELQRLQTLARHMADRFAEENPPSESELRNLYQENLPRLQRTQYETRHILVETEEEAEDLIDEIEDGADFQELAREHTIDTNGDEGGYLGWLDVEGVVEPFGAALIVAAPGEVVPEPIETEFGWHVVLVDEIRENTAPGLEAVRQDVTVAAESTKLAEFVESLRDSAEVEIVD